ncbi:ethanolamine permease [Terrimonas sp. NA20]|uniref:Ethanolamine permease n=1 Tax=Terrimonas ginsenosidimutans TaxID=2908004 RepID=A0ABS9KZK6_9BACT|nr:ethanolamine permease [Terrimonas ginsenosidimutans]MCG2617730.1 ethanolamine permease [Terrimonas ginsenosidimutans]
MANTPAPLKKVLTTIHLWAIAVGLVISGEYFGWNYGWAVAGTGGLLVATGIVTILYLCLVFSFTELSTSIPNAGGPFAFAVRALGPTGGFIAGFATLFEFLLAAPAIAFALGSYLHFLYPGLDIMYTAIGCYILFSIINVMGIRESALFTLLVTMLAVLELLIYMGLVTPHFQWERFSTEAFPFGISGIFAALPFAIWLYLAIEGVAMVAEETKDPAKTIPRGYISGIFTLMILAMGVMILTGGTAPWQELSSIDYPLPETIGRVLGKDNQWTKLFAGIGLFGLIASFHSIIIGYSRQIFALARAGYLPHTLAKVSTKRQTPDAALVAGGLIGVLAIVSGTTDKLIILSVLGALVMYIVSMISLFRLRKIEPQLDRPFKAPFYPWFPLIALLLSVLCLISIIYFNLQLSAVFFSIMLLAYLLYRTILKRKTIPQ